MQPWKSLALVALLVIGACVTINVYFPAAAATEAADQFIQGVLDEEPPADFSDESNSEPQASYFSPLDFFISSAHAQGQANIDISTPAIKAIQERMRKRMQSELRPYFNSGAVGLDNNAMVAIRELSAVPLAKRNAVRSAVAAENRDRAAVYREIAVANGHAEWEGQIRSIFAERWVSNAVAGWYYQNNAGAWQQK